VLADLMWGRARTASMAALCMADWWGEPISGEAHPWRVDAGAAREVAAALGIDLDLVKNLLDARPANPGDLVEEHERLFVGPGRTPCPPYGAFWRPARPWQEGGSIAGESTSRVAAIYAQLDLRIRGEWSEPPDHVAFEWEALAYALGVEHSAGRALLDEHLRVWLPPFCEAVQKHAKHPFYLALATLTPVWVEGFAVFEKADGKGKTGALASTG
jgi:TorA maturation chaperone TorD